MNRQLLVVTGMTREAQAVSGEGLATLCSGGDSARLAGLLDDLDATAFWGVVSFGIAGGLDPELAPGDLLLGAYVAHVDERYDSCVNLTASLRRNLFSRDLRVAEGAFLGSNEAILTPGHKSSLRAASGALAVDMESHVAARWAAANGLPFSILRVVSDPAHRALPALAADALRPDGGVDVLRVVKGLARAPSQLGALIGAGLDARAAFAALAGAGACLQGARLAAPAAAPADEDGELAIA